MMRFFFSVCSYIYIIYYRVEELKEGDARAKKARGATVLLIQYLLPHTYLFWQSVKLAFVTRNVVPKHRHGIIPICPRLRAPRVQRCTLTPIWTPRKCTARRWCRHPRHLRPAPIQQIMKVYEETRIEGPPQYHSGKIPRIVRGYSCR